MTALGKYIVAVFLSVHTALLFGQAPVAVPLDHNPVLRHRKPTDLTFAHKIKSSIPADTVSLPFMDDFSDYYFTSQPDRKLWLDDHVYINNHYPVQPRSNGVATFDALDASGNIYKSSATTFPADTLTSCPVDLGDSGLNNVYLSFFYQPQGYGDNPEEGDSLILQFKLPATEKWRTVWNTEGTAVHPFKQVLLPVEGEYLQKGFQFRFINLVSLEQDRFNPGRKGNADHWNIDYVRLDKNRNEKDTASLDIAVITPMKTLITGYQSIPWDQLQYAIATRLEPTVDITYRNNDNLDHLVYRNFTTTDVYSSITNSLAPGGAENIAAGETVTFRQNIINPFESTSVDSALFELKGYLETGQLDRKVNDTVRFYQFFKDYFARDDGSPESGYGFSGYNAQGCAIACRYETFMPDTLRAVMIHFNQTDNNASSQYRFRIAVWRDDSGRPGELIHISSTEYSPETAGQFTQYELERTVYATKYYWIGWVQVTTGFMNAGFDRNYNDRGNLWYNDGSWKEDFNDGTLMIRPVMGKSKAVATSAEQPARTNVRMQIYPNPASQYVRIELETGTPADCRVEIYDAAGRLHYSAAYTEHIDVSGFEPGIYIVRLMNISLRQMQADRLIIMR